MDQIKKGILMVDHADIFQGGGEIGQLMKSFDWDKHPLGNPLLWPSSIKTNIRLMLNSSFPMFIWWTDELYCFYNDAYIPALGKKHPHVLGEPAPKVWAEIWGTLESIVRDIQKTGVPFYAEALLLYLERKGFLEETYWTFSYSPVFNDNGEIKGIFCACTEVTSRVFSDRRLKSLKDVSEKLNQTQTLEQAGQLTCNILLENEMDLPFSMIYLLNGTATEASLIGKSGNLPFEKAPESINILQAEAGFLLEKVLETKQLQVVDLPSDSNKIFTGAPADRPVQAVVVPVVRPGQEQVIGFFIAGLSPTQEYNNEYRGFHTLLAGQIATSITSIQAREELARQQKYLQNIFQQAPVGIAIVSGPQYVIDLANPGVCEIWGRKPEEVLGRSVKDALPEVVDQGILQLLDSVMNTGEPFITNEFPLSLERHGVLEQVYLNFIYQPMRDSQGFISGVIAVAVDVSEQVRYRQSVEALNVELLATNADLDNFVYSASHDLKAPISNIEGLMNALVDDLPEEVLGSGTVRRIVELIQTSIDRFKRAVTDLTEVAKLQRDTGDDVESIHLDSVVREVQLDFEAEIAATDAHIEAALNPDAIIRFSAKNVRSIVYNLFSNALKYRSPERKTFIKISTSTEPDFVVLVVEDNGLGFHLDHKSKVFSMFKRLHDHVEGSGIGLFIVKRIIENAGGKIEVESEVGKGSIFRIYFKR